MAVAECPYQEDRMKATELVLKSALTLSGPASVFWPAAGEKTSFFRKKKRRPFLITRHVRSLKKISKTTSFLDSLKFSLSIALLGAPIRPIDRKLRPLAQKAHFRPSPWSRHFPKTVPTTLMESFLSFFSPNNAELEDVDATGMFKLYWKSQLHFFFSHRDIASIHDHQKFSMISNLAKFWSSLQLRNYQRATIKALEWA